MSSSRAICVASAIRQAPAVGPGHPELWVTAPCPQAAPVQEGETQANACSTEGQRGRNSQHAVGGGSREEGMGWGDLRLLGDRDRMCPEAQCSCWGDSSAGTPWPVLGGTRDLVWLEQRQGRGRAVKGCEGRGREQAAGAAARGGIKKARGVLCAGGRILDSDEDSGQKSCPPAGPRLWRWAHEAASGVPPGEGAVRNGLEVSSCEAHAALWGPSDAQHCSGHCRAPGASATLLREPRGESPRQRDVSGIRNSGIRNSGILRLLSGIRPQKLQQVSALPTETLKEMVSV